MNIQKLLFGFLLVVTLLALAVTLSGAANTPTSLAINFDESASASEKLAGFDYVIHHCPGGVCNPPVYPVPDMSKPEKGVLYRDPNFHTSVSRVTDRVGDGLPDIWQGSEPLDRAVLVPEYARSDPENADGTKLIVTLGEYSLFLYDANTYDFIKCLTSLCGGKIPENVEGSLEPRWDAKDPNVFYYVQGMGFYQYDISTDTITLIHDFAVEFPNGWRLFNDAEGEPSWDTRYWAFSVQRTGDWAKYAIITYDLQQDQIMGRMEQGVDSEWPDCSPYGQYCGMNTITVSPHGDRVIVEWDWQSASGTSTWAYDLDFGNPVALGNDGHSDIGLTADARQVHIIKDDSNDVIAMLDINTGERTNLLQLPLSGSWDAEGCYHISGNNYEKPGWALVSTYAGSSGNWHYYQVFMLELKENSRIWQIAHTHGEYGGDSPYWTETKATINRKGTRIYWGSNWGNLVGDVDTYQAILPATWREDLGGTPSLSLNGAPADQAIHLSWTVNTTLPVTSTWQIDYQSETGTLYTPITNIISPTRAYTLTGLTNYTWYTVTLNGMLALSLPNGLDSTPFLTDTVKVMPTDIFVYLPLVLRAYGP